MNRIAWLLPAALLLLYAKVLLSILAEYRGYFPPDFENSAFLIGRRATFEGLYPIAFYAHLLSGPPAALLALFLLATGGRAPFLRWHRVAGRVLLVVVLAALVPSGLVMANHAFAGPIAGAGFVCLSLATAGGGLLTFHFARRRNFAAHRHAAMVWFLLLMSPLLLRVISGAASVLQWDSPPFYQFNAWFSWVAPLACYALWRWRPRAIPRLLTLSQERASP